MVSSGQVSSGGIIHCLLPGRLVPQCSTSSDAMSVMMSTRTGIACGLKWYARCEQEVPYEQGAGVNREFGVNGVYGVNVYRVNGVRDARSIKGEVQRQSGGREARQSD